MREIYNKGVRKWKGAKKEHYHIKHLVFTVYVTIFLTSLFENFFHIEDWFIFLFKYYS